MALAIVAELVIETLFQRAACGVEHAHTPFAGHRGRVAGGFQNLRHSDGLGWQRKLSLIR
jgi:hypothetical protein